MTPTMLRSFVSSPLFVILLIQARLRITYEAIGRLPEMPTPIVSYVDRDVYTETLDCRELERRPIRNHNRDLPDEMHSIEQGYTHLINEHLLPAKQVVAVLNPDKPEKPPAWLRWALPQTAERPWSRRLVEIARRKIIVQGQHQTMDNIDFRQRCVQLGPAGAQYNYALDMKSKNDFLPPTYLRAEWLAEKLSIEVDLAMQLALAFRKLSVTSWPLARRLLFGVRGSGFLDTHRRALKLEPLKSKQLKGGIKTDAESNALYLIELAEQLPEPMPPREEDPCTILGPFYKQGERSYHNAPLHISEYWDWRMIYSVKIQSETAEQQDDFMNEEEALLEPPTDDEMDLGGAANPFSAHKLYGDGSDSLGFGYTSWLASADDQALAEEAKKMYPTEKGWIEYGWFSPAQKAHFWALWNARKQALAERAMVDKNYRNTFNWVKQATRGEAAAAIYAYVGRKPHEAWGFKICDGKQSPSKSIVRKLWEVFNERFPKAIAN